MAISNKLLVEFKHEKIDLYYDFYLIRTSDNYIPFGAKCLDVQNVLGVESIAFENGQSLYIMTKKEATTKFDLVNKIEDEKLSVTKVYSDDIAKYMLFRLFLYSLNNFESESLSFNNLTGKFYIYKTDWMKKNRSSFIAIEINVDSNMNIVLEAATFAKLSFFKENLKAKNYPKYVFSNKNNALKRVFTNTKSDEIYIKKGIYNKKAEIPFLTLSQVDIKNNKVYYLYYVLELLKKRYNEMLSFSFEPIDIIATIGIERNKDFMVDACREFGCRSVNFVNYAVGTEYKEEFKELVSAIQNKAKNKFFISSDIKENCSNIVLIHNKEYYEQQKYYDPYKTLNRSKVVQCVTVEDSAEKIIEDNNAIINTIIKEVVVKNDIVFTRKISLDSWADYKYDGDWVFGKEKEGRHYFIVIHPNGEFDLFNKINDFNTFPIETLNKCSDYLTDNKGKEKIIIASHDGSLNVITRTNRYPLPEKTLFDLDVISRSKESRDKYFSGLVDINLYMRDGDVYYSSSIKGNGMNLKIVRAPHLYKVEVINGKNLMPELLETLSTTFVKYKTFTVLPYPIKYLNEYILMSEQTLQN